MGSILLENFTRMRLYIIFMTFGFKYAIVLQYVTHSRYSTKNKLVSHSKTPTYLEKKTKKIDCSLPKTPIAL